MKSRVIILTVMPAMLAAAAAVAAGPQADPLATRVVASPHRSLSDIQMAVRAALRAEASTRRLGPNTPEVIRLLDLYREMAVHPKRDQSVLLTRLGLRLRSRLKEVRDHIERQESHPARHAKKKDARRALVAPETRVLAQQIAVPGGAGFGQGAQPVAGQAGAVRTPDYGPELVELIQQTISPATWDINGGNGSVVYFAPLRVIVVSAPATVHDQVGDVLGQLRAAP